MGHNPTAAMALLIVAVGCNGFIYAGEQSAMLDIANNFAGTLMGVINALGNTMGFVAPLVLIAKLMFQELCGRSCTWDEIVPPEIHNRFESWLGELTRARQVVVDLVVLGGRLVVLKLEAPSSSNPLEVQH